MSQNRIYAWDKRNGQVVYRILGHTHGDGQTDTNTNPIWLLADPNDVMANLGYPEIADLPDIDPEEPIG